MIEQRAGALADGPLVERLLVTEAGVEGGFRGAGACGDLLHAGGAESIGGELGPCGREDGRRCWSREGFPYQGWTRLADLGVGGIAIDGYGCAGRGVLDGFIAIETAAVDCLVATGLGVHNHFAMGSIYLCGSEGQKDEWLPRTARFDAIGAFGLTEPEVGSGVARGLQTTARRDGDTWVLNGAKRWVGSAAFADLTIIWARDEADDDVKGFIVEKDATGFTATKTAHNVAPRAVQNADVTLEDVVVPESHRLQNANTFMDTANVLAHSRAAVAWQAAGCARGAYELALQYATGREQFGRPIAKFQLVQDLLVRMLGNVVAAQCMALRLAQLEAVGQAGVHHASLAKAFDTAKMRETGLPKARRMLTRRDHVATQRRRGNHCGCGSAPAHDQ